MDISFDPGKAAGNLRKHGVSFEEALTALFDERALVREDRDNGELRFILLGMSARLRLLVVVYAIWDEDADVIRLISARRATANEGQAYGR